MMYKYPEHYVLISIRNKDNLLDGIVMVISLKPVPSYD